ncbi:MAG: hypothetical protein A2V67_01625 [Deltaproteobacteria bacterium RBG_13_61_14]|nr:MAG: hypothetical protein A2V67_01625 [Deltaproteobacteria bacterium RBG_13_61_14]
MEPWTWLEMSGNGCRIGILKNIIRKVLPRTLQALQAVMAASFEVVVGETMHGTWLHSGVSVQKMLETPISVFVARWMSEEAGIIKFLMIKI